MQHCNAAGSTCATYRQCNAARGTQAMHAQCNAANTHATKNSAALREATRIRRNTAGGIQALQAVHELCTQYNNTTGRQRAISSRPAPQGLKWQVTWSPPHAGAAQRGDVSAARRVAAVSSQDGVAAAVGAGAVPGARREGDAGPAVAALLLPLLQRAPLPRVRLARGNGRPATPRRHTERGAALRARLLAALFVVYSRLASSLARGSGRGWAQRCPGLAMRLAVHDRGGGASRWIGSVILSICGTWVLIGEIARGRGGTACRGLSSFGAVRPCPGPGRPLGLPESVARLYCELRKHQRLKKRYERH